MKLLITLVALTITAGLSAQSIITPVNNVAEKKWITNAAYKMAWYALKDTAKIEIGKMITSINIRNNSVLVVTDVRLNQSQAGWIDSTIAGKNDLSPVYHSSYNAQRNMVLHFGTVVKGYYFDKLRDVSSIINDTTRQGYFDSNLYPLLVTWLPLQEGYTADISIYDYKPGSSSGVMKASVQNVKKAVYSTMKSGDRKVWVVSVTDEITGAANGTTTYYIDVFDRRLWKQQIEVGSRKMELVRIEN